MHRSMEFDGEYMKWLACLILGIGVTASSPTAARANDGPRRARALVRAVLANMSLERDVSRLASIYIDGHETIKDLVENDHPLTPPFQSRFDANIRRDWDFGRHLQRTDFAGPGGPMAILVSRAAVVTMFGPAGNRQRLVTTPTPSWETREPIAALQMARRAADLRLRPDVTNNGVRVHVVSFHDGRYAVRILINAASLLPTAVESKIAFDDQHDVEAVAWNALGDILERTEFMGWAVVDGIRYPLAQDEFRNGDLYRSLSIKDLSVGKPVDPAGFALKPGEANAPASVQDFRPTSHVPGPYPGKPIVEIAPGIIQIPNSWYTVIVRQRDGLVIIDAPISAGYSKGVLAEAEKRFPGVRIKALITSTGFFWHVAGVREYAARGIPIYAEARNVPVIKKFLGAPHQIIPDALSRSRRKKYQINSVGGPTVIGSGMNSLTLLPVAAATQPMLMTYIPGSKLLHTAEMVQPLGPGGAILYPESLIELADTVQADGLRVDRIIGMHMSPTPWKAIGAALCEVGITRHSQTF